MSQILDVEKKFHSITVVHLYGKDSPINCCNNVRACTRTRAARVRASERASERECACLRVCPGSHCSSGLIRTWRTSVCVRACVRACVCACARVCRHVYMIAFERVHVIGECACVHAYVRACTRMCARACVRVCVSHSHRESRFVFIMVSNESLTRALSPQIVWTA